MESKRIGLGSCENCGDHKDLFEVQNNDSSYYLCEPCYKLKVENSDPKAGLKFSKNKLKWNLLPIREIEQVVEVLTKGAIKYAPDNWKYVENAMEEYYASMMRHIAARRKGEKIDPDMKTPHLANAITCLIFQLWFDNEEDENGRSD